MTVNVRDILPDGLPNALNNYVQWEDSAKLDNNNNPKIVRRPMEINAIYKKLCDYCGSWPKALGNALYVLENNDFFLIKSVDALFSFAQDQGMILQWASIEGSVTKGVFFEHVLRKADRYESFEKIPHFPLLPNFYYHIEKPPANELLYKGKLNELLAMFKPETPQDAAYLKAMFLTPGWGAGPGQKRPAFCLLGPANDSGDGRGVGKTTITDILGSLYGPAVDINGMADRDKITGRLLTAKKGTRLVRLDNIKDRLSNGDIESLITTEYISGHQLYVGDQTIPNTFTWILTYNQPDFSKDMAQRAIPIRLARPEYDPQWEVRVSDFVKQNKALIMHDINRILQIPPLCKLTKYIRFAPWCDAVLVRSTINARICEEIETRQSETEESLIDTIDMIKECIDGLLEEYRYVGGLKGTVPYDPEGSCYRIKRSIVTARIRRDMDGMSPRALFQILAKSKPDWLCLPNSKDTKNSRGAAFLGPKVRGIFFLDVGNDTVKRLWLVDEESFRTPQITKTIVRSPILTTVETDDDDKMD